jgi:hypothetical protein
MEGEDWGVFVTLRVAETQAVGVVLAVWLLETDCDSELERVRQLVGDSVEVMEMVLDREVVRQAVEVRVLSSTFVGDTVVEDVEEKLTERLKVGLKDKEDVLVTTSEPELRGEEETEGVCVCDADTVVVVEADLPMEGLERAEALTGLAVAGEGDASWEGEAVMHGLGVLGMEGVGRWELLREDVVDWEALTVCVREAVGHTLGVSDML